MVTDQSVPSNPDINLKPNPSIQTVEADPAFTASGNPFNIPNSVLAIKSMLQRYFCKKMYPVFNILIYIKFGGGAKRETKKNEALKN